jgi:hypothetical protein
MRTSRTPLVTHVVSAVPALSGENRIRLPCPRDGPSAIAPGGRRSAPSVRTERRSALPQRHCGRAFSLKFRVSGLRSRQVHCSGPMTPTTDDFYIRIDGRFRARGVGHFILLCSHHPPRSAYKLARRRARACRAESRSQRAPPRASRRVPAESPSCRCNHIRDPGRAESARR